MKATREQALSYRLHAQGLATDDSKRTLVDVASVGVQDISFESMMGAFAARLPKVTRIDIENALYVKKELIGVHSMRGSAHVVPARELATFTLGVLPQSEKEMSSLMVGAATHLKKNGVDVMEAVERLEFESLMALEGRKLTFNELHAILKQKVPRTYLKACVGCKSNHVQMLHLAAAGLWGGMCFGPDQGIETTFVRTDEWLKKMPKEVPPDKAAAELARKYLHFYGPTTESAFANWAGVSSLQARRAWTSIFSEITEVSVDGAKAFILKDDCAKLKAVRPAKGLKLLSPHDPYLNSRDRELVVPDPKLRSKVWRVVGNPGALLLDGEVRGVWRPQKKGKKFNLILEAFGKPFAPLSTKNKKEIEVQAQRLAILRGAEIAVITVE